VPDDDDLRARFVDGDIDSMEAASAFGRPVSIRLPRLAWLQLLGWINADRYEPGTIPWMDDLLHVIEKGVT
jgi:hypothetical protein